VLARVPLASGMLTGRLSRDTAFGPDDHRRFNRYGEQFDVGETFAGVDYETGLAVVEELRTLVPERATMAQMALRWILMHEAVSATIPGAKTPEQARAIAGVADAVVVGSALVDRIARSLDDHGRAEAGLAAAVLGEVGELTEGVRGARRAAE